MRPTHRMSHAHLPRATQRLARVSAASLVLSVMLMLAAGFTGPSATVPAFPSAFPWPPYTEPLHLFDVVAIGLAWLAVGIGGLGLVAGLVAARPRRAPAPPAVLHRGQAGRHN